MADWKVCHKGIRVTVVIIFSMHIKREDKNGADLETYCRFDREKRKFMGVSQI